MGNIYRIMVDITLTCRLHRDIKKNVETFDIKVVTTDSILSLEDKIYDAVKNKDDKIFSGIEAKDLDLWKVKIKNGNEDVFSKLDLKSNDIESIKKIRGITISDFWEEQPPTDCTHVIVDSRYLSLLRDFPSQTRLNQELIGKNTQKTDKQGYISSGYRQIDDAITEKIIIQDDELWVNKKYHGVKVEVGCRVIDVTKIRPKVSLIDNEDEKHELIEWKGLEKWLLYHYKKRTNVNLDLERIEYKHASSNIRLVRDGIVLGIIQSLIKNHNENI